MKAAIEYFSKRELFLWSGSAGMIIVSFLLFDRGNMLTLAASLIGVTSIMINAKGNPLGQVLMIIFSLLYGIISYSFSYYGEMLTYLGMTMPMAGISLISWLKNPYEGDKKEVSVGNMGRQETFVMCILAVIVTGIFYIVLCAFDTANIIPSTISVTTSFLAVYLTYKRSTYFAAAYAANDLILILLWSLASVEDIRYVSVVVCFCAFFINDLYGFASWKRMEKRQKACMDFENVLI